MFQIQLSWGSKTHYTQPVGETPSLSSKKNIYYTQFMLVS